MATIFAHALIPITLRAALGRNIMSNRLLGLACISAMLPDADVVGFKFGIEYASAFGHRGASHSFVFALCFGLFCMLFAKQLHASKLATLLIITFSTASHTMLDAMTSGGHGVAFFWPYNDERYFLPWRPIKVSPIGAAFFSERGMQTVISEAKTVLLWCAVVGSVGFGLRRVFSPKET